MQKGADMALRRPNSTHSRRSASVATLFRVVLMRCSEAAEVMTLNAAEPEATTETLLRNRDPRAWRVRGEPVTN